VSKTTEHVLLVPGESGWEIWTGPSTHEYSLHAATTVELASDITDLPAGDLVLLFPVKAITAVPMRVASDDEALFPDLAALHAERLGLRPDPMAGQLTDVFVIAREAENSALVSVLLRTPGDNELPTRGPKGFDLSARAYAQPGDTLAVWKEFGRWVFSLSHQGNLVYCQATSSTSGSPDEALAREIRLALIQLSLQGMEIEPSRVVIWTRTEGVSTAALVAAFRAPVEIAVRPAPTLPSPLSKLLPADVRAARRAALKRRNILLGVAAVALLYLGLIGWYSFGLWKDSSETKKLRQQAEAAAPEGKRYSEHIAKWDELADALNVNHSPVEILKNIKLCIPNSSGLRLTTAEISSESVKLKGEAQQFQSVSDFNKNLSKRSELARFEWQLPDATQSTRGWEFVYSGDVPANN
jgi:Tfp pilus assembly protein PilN